MSYGNGESGRAYSGAATMSVPTSRQAAITEQMVMLEQRTETLNQLAAELEARISGVLMPVPPSQNKEGLAPPQSPVPLGASIGQMNDRLGLVAQRLRGIIERVEL